MEKYEFKARQPLWIWATVIGVMVGVITYTVMTGNYFLIIMWCVYNVFVLISNRRVYTITPENFIIKQGWDKPRTFLLQEIIDIEKKYTKDHRLKSVIVRYVTDEKYHNFFEIRKYDTDAEGILNAILDYRPSVPVH